MIKSFSWKCCLLLFLSGCAQDFASNDIQKNPIGLTNGITPKNVILLVGNGMGISQISAGLHNKRKLNFEKFPIIGIHKPYSYDNLIPDSGASATALSTGVKTYNGAIGVDSDTQKVSNILEECDIKGFSSGLISTSSITYATLAAFYAHVPSKEAQEDIAVSLITSGVDFFAGGGMQHFSDRSDGINLLEALEKKDFQVIQQFDSWPKEAPLFDPNQKVALFTAEKEVPKAADGRDYLKPVTVSAIQYLKERSSEGFFLVVEASQIGIGGRDNNTEYIIEEILDLDKTVGAVLDFAIEDGETLVLLTGNNESGGFALNVGSTDKDLIGAFTTTENTGTLIPVFAYGPGAKLFSGIYENTALYHKMRTALQLDARSVILD